MAPNVRVPTERPRPTCPPPAARLVHAGDQMVFELEPGDLPTSVFEVRLAPRPGEVAGSVAAFHRAFGLPIQAAPTIDGVETALLALRSSLLDEEATEFSIAAARRDLVGMADALADVVYVCYGTALTLGIDLDAVVREVHRANMSKLDADGRPVMRDDGKVLKSPRYSPPDVHRVLSQQLPLPL